MLASTSNAFGLIWVVFVLLSSCFILFPLVQAFCLHSRHAETKTEINLRIKVQDLVVVVWVVEWEWE